MKKNIFKALVSLGISLAICMPAFATETTQVQYDYSQNEVTISGDVVGEHIVLRILDIGKDLDDLKAEPYDDSLVIYRNQADLSASDGYSFTVRYAEPDDTSFASGTYNAYLTSDALDEPDKFVLNLYTCLQYKDAIETLNQYAATDDSINFKDYLGDNSAIFAYNPELYKCISSTDELAACMNYIKLNPLDPDAGAENARIINTFLAMQTITEGKMINADAFLSSIIRVGSELYSKYKEYTESVEEKEIYLTGKLNGELPSEYKYEDFALAMKKAIILTGVRFADGFGDAKSVITLYGSTIGITTAAADSVYKNMSGNDYTNSDTLKSAYDTLKNSGNDSGIQGGTTGGYTGGLYTVESPEFVTSEPISVYFNDLNGVEWAAKAILALADKGIVHGTGDGNFKPNLNITREEFAKILVGAMGLSETERKGNAFTDVSEEDWFCHYVNVAYENGIAKGIGGGKFGTGELITRQDMVVMIYNALLSKGNILTEATFMFDDEGQISDYAKSAVAALYELGAVSGVSDTRFEPMGNATRAQAAKVIYIVIDMLR